MAPGHVCSHCDLQYPLLVLLPTRVAGSAPPAAGRRGAFLPGFFDSGLFLGRKHDAFTCRCIASTAIGACQQGTKPAERGGRCCWFMQFGDSPEQFFHHLLWHRTIQKRFFGRLLQHRRDFRDYRSRRCFLRRPVGGEDRGSLPAPGTGRITGLLEVVPRGFVDNEILCCAHRAGEPDHIAGSCACNFRFCGMSCHWQVFGFGAFSWVQTNDQKRTWRFFLRAKGGFA